MVFSTVLKLTAAPPQGSIFAFFLVPKLKPENEAKIKHVLTSCVVKIWVMYMYKLKFSNVA